MKLGFIGCGNMAQAMISGLLGHVDAAHIMASNRSQDKLKQFSAQTQIRVGSNEEVAKFSDYLFIAVKPDQVEMVLTSISSLLKTNQVVVSLAAGIELDVLQSYVSCQVIRLMPNTPIQVRQAAMALCSTQKDDKLTKLLACLGRVYWIEPSQMSAFIGIAGSSPAYFFMMMDAMGDAAVRHGIKKEDALDMIAQTMLGSAALYLETKEHPIVLKDKVTSLKGTTIEGVVSLEQHGFKATLIDTITKVVEKDEGKDHE